MSLPEPKFSIGDMAILCTKTYPVQKVKIMDREYGAFLNIGTNLIETLWVYELDIETKGDYMGEPELRPVPPKATKTLQEILATKYPQIKHKVIA